MAIVCLVLSGKTWESLFQNLVKALRTKEAEETVIRDATVIIKNFFKAARKNKSSH